MCTVSRTTGGTIASAEPRRLIRRPDRQEALEHGDSAKPEIHVTVFPRRPIRLPRRQEADQIFKIFHRSVDPPFGCAHLLDGC